MDIEIQTKLLQLKGVLNDISHASFSYSQLTRDYPMHELDINKASKMITALSGLVTGVKNSITNYENQNKPKATN